MKLAVVVALIFVATSAMASPNCMTQREARAQYRTSYIYWRTKHHCWYAHGARRQIVRIVPTPAPRPVLASPTEFELRFLGQ